MGQYFKCYTIQNDEKKVWDLQPNNLRLLLEDAEDIGKAILYRK